MFSAPPITLLAPSEESAPPRYKILWEMHTRNCFDRIGSCRLIFIEIAGVTGRMRLVSGSTVDF